MMLSMDESLPRTAEFVRVVFQILWPKDDGLPVRELLEAFSAKIKPTEAEKALDPRLGMPQFEKMVRLATNTLVEIGWFVKTKERWSLSAEGRTACQNLREAGEFYKTALRLRDEKKQLQSELFMTSEDAEEKAWQQISQFLNSMHPVEFKVLVADLLKALDYQLDWVAPPGKTHGYLDLIAFQQPFGSSGTRLKVHIRQKGQAATLEGLKAFQKVLTPNDLGLYLSTGGFTNLVTEQVRLEEFRNLRLISLEDFFELWVQNAARLSPDARERFPLKPIYFLLPHA